MNYQPPKDNAAGEPDQCEAWSEDTKARCKKRGVFRVSGSWICRMHNMEAWRRWDWTPAGENKTHEQLERERMAERMRAVLEDD